MTSKPRPLGTDDFGRLVNKISIDLQIKDQLLFRTILARDWDAARAYLNSDEFAAIEPTVEFLTITRRDA
jgi:hypothetical protein